MLKTYMKKSMPALLAFTCISGWVSTAAAATVLSDNLSRAVADTEAVGGDTWIASSFGTDSNAYTLSAATLLLDNSTGSPAQLFLYSSASGRPGTSLGSLGSPNNFGNSIAQATFGGNGLSLAANTTYWLVLESPLSLGWAWTNNNSGSGVGFQHTFGASDDGGASWFVTDLSPMMMSVTADPIVAVPEPGAVGLLLCGVMCIAVVTTNVRKSRRKGESNA